jgi:co-chaperonin GroES (HSP10)
MREDMNNITIRSDIAWIRPIPDSLASSIIHLPTDETTHIGEVLKIGPGRRNIPITEVSEGDRVLFGSSTGESFYFNDEQLLAMRVPDIMAVLE